MIERSELKDIVILRNMPEQMLDKLIPIIDILRFDEDECIFTDKEIAVRFYMLRKGKVLLEHRLSDKVTVSLGAIKPGYSFGWSSMLGDQRYYTTDAVAAEACDVFSIKGDKFRKMLDEDHSMGYFITQRLLNVVKNRLDHRTEQFLRAIKEHPEIHNLI